MIHIIGDSLNPKQIINLLKSETFEESHKALEQALEIYPDSPDLLNIKGDLLQEK